MPRGVVWDASATTVQLTFLRLVFTIRHMKKKNTAAFENNRISRLLAEDSPRDFLWETFQPAPGLPEVNHFGYIDTKEAITIGEHWHPDTFEFVYIEKGKASWEIGRQHYETKEGDMLCTRPDELHRASRDILEPCRLWNFGLRTPYVSEAGMEHNWMQQNAGDIRRLLDGLFKLPRVTFLGAGPLPALRRLAGAVQQPGLHSRLDGRTAVIDLMLQLLETTKSEKMETDRINLSMETLINTLASQLGESLSVEEMAAQTGISVAYFYRLFLKHTGMTPRTYLERLRIQEACRRLTETKASVTLISMDLGFATSQHFARVFRRLTGSTPTAWRQNKLNTNSWFVTFNSGQYDFIKVPNDNKHS